MVRRTARQWSIERASSTDRAFLAMDRGGVPEHIAAVLMFDAGTALTLERVRELMRERVPAVPRLRQKLHRVPCGYGGPIWVDDTDFDVGAHVSERVCRPPGDESALLATALEVVTTRLPREGPYWAAVLIGGLPDGRRALVVTLHHVLADGLGGLSVLGAFCDPGMVAHPRPAVAAPPAGALFAQAWQARAAAVRAAPATWRALRAATAAGGGLRPPRAAPCSLVRRAGRHRRMSVITVDGAGLAASAHRVGATTNSAVLVAVAAALSTVLASRGESIDPLVVTVPVSGRPRGDTGTVGNIVSPLLVPVPTRGTTQARLRQVAAVVAAHRADATGPPPIAILGWLFRPVAALGGYEWYMRHQHRLHTLVTHVRGPVTPISFGGHRVTSTIPVSVGDNGNTTVMFAVMSYAGSLTVSTIVDPDHFAELDLLTERLRAELKALIRPGRPPR